MNFSLDKTIEVLERTPSTYKTLFQDLSRDWVYANEGENTWSPFDIVGHLIHGEKTDWIPRATIILTKGTAQKFEVFDRFAQGKVSAGKTMNQLLEEFSALRHQNLQTLKSWQLSESDLEKTGMHPDDSIGLVTLQQLLATWTIHDLNHPHQASRVMVKHYGKEIGPWKAYSNIIK